MGVTPGVSPTHYQYDSYCEVNCEAALAYQPYIDTSRGSRFPLLIQVVACCCLDLPPTPYLRRLKITCQQGREGSTPSSTARNMSDSNAAPAGKPSPPPLLSPIVSRVIHSGNAISFEVPMTFNDWYSKTTYRLVKLWAGQGTPDAQFHLGYLYHMGRGVAQDNAEAARWYRKAADQGFADAQNAYSGDLGH